MMWFRSAAIIALTFISSGQAFANWQYTKWGMSPDDVVAASGGTATPLSARDIAGKSLPTQKALIGAPYQTGDLRFLAIFYFSPEMHLVRIVLQQQGGDKYQLRRELLGKYGAPFRQAGDVLEWLTDAESVQYWDLLGPQVEYRPRMTAENSGL